MNVLAWIRKSEGSDDDIGLKQQRRAVKQLAREYDEDFDTLDLGVQTGFSSMTRDDDQGPLDQREDVQRALERIRNGQYDIVAAYDDTRVCRDEFLQVITYALQQGNASFDFVTDVPEDSLTRDVQRAVSKRAKQEEIQKAKAAIQERMEQGYYQGGPPTGMEFQNGQLVKSDEFETVERVLSLRDEGLSYGDIADDVELPKSTVYNIVQRRDTYEKYT